jgi:predicted ATPase/class 3 adenylate cyclase/DNA-binding CsgD family transcriptional regulator
MSQLPTGTVTLLFTDIEGSTLLLQQLGERYAEMLATCRQLLRTAFKQWNGVEVDTQGDAFFVVFARASDAISAVIDMQRALASHDWPNGAAVALRIGLHTGEPTRTAEGYIGLDVHHAARIMSVGHGGQVLLSQTTHELVKHTLTGGVSLRDLGEHRLKDLLRPAHLYQLIIADLPADFPPLKTLDNSPNNLPVQPTSLIGRQKEVATVLNLLQREEVRLLTLTGPGGTGKTRLGLQAAAELDDTFSDGVYFVNLAPISDPDLVVPALAQTLDVKEIAGQPLLDLLKTSLHWKYLLLLLDNFEQVVSAAVYVAELLAVCPNLKVLVTSRMTLHIRGEQEFPVPPLAVPDPQHLPDLVALSEYESVELFVSRAQATKPTFHLTATDAHTIAEICVQLDGLPLAIELAATRIKVLPPQALLTRLGQRLAMLTGGAKDVPARQQTLRNTIEWSYQLLDAQEQLLFRRLSVFVGGCTLEAIEAVCDALDKNKGAVSVLDGVTSLIDKSLLRQAELEEPRLVMLEIIREYGLEALAVHGEIESTRQAHATYYLRFSEEAEPELHGPQQVMWLERLEQEHDNLRAALRWLLEQGETNQSRKEMALRLAGELGRFWSVRCHYSEGRTFLKQALAGSEQIRAAVRAKALLAAGEFALDQGDYDLAEVLLEETLALFRQIGDRRGIAHTLWELGKVAVERGGLTAGRILFVDALTHAREVDDKEYAAWLLAGLAYIESNQGEYARARSLLEEALMMQRALGNKKGIVSSLLHLAEVLIVSQSDRATADPLLEEGLELSKELGDKEGIEHFFFLSGQLALNQGDIATARRLSEKTLVINREIGSRSNTAESLFLLARVEARQGDHVAARALYEEGLALTKEVGNKWNIASYLEGLAQVVALQGEELWAARLWGAANALREAIHTPLPPIDRADYERSVAAARGSLGEKAFTAAWSQGRVMSPEQALVTQEREMIMSLPADQPPTSPMKSSPIYPNGLTAREVEVLRLLATGLTDAQIAEQLVLSLHTIHAHLRTIYSKLGVTSRSAATRYAFEHQLV